MRLNKNDRRLPGKQIQDFRQALHDAFSKSSFEDLLLFQLNRHLEDFSSGRDFLTDLKNVIVKADEESWTAELLQAARMWRQQNLALLVFSQQFGLAPAFTSSNVFESKVRPHLVDIDVAQWRMQLSELEAQICCIEIAGNRADDFGTGFLLGPDIVMTSYHVMEKVIKGQIAPEKVTLRFDYKALEDGRTVYKGTEYYLAQPEWRIDYSEYSELDRLADTNGALPTLDELDYILLKIDGKPGEAHPFGKDNRDPHPRKRGWISLPSAPLQLFEGMELLILHHPEGDRLKFTLDTNSVLFVNANQTRIRYQTNTAHGTSGAPCFNLSWKLVALHHTGDPNAGSSRQARFNQGIPFSTILNRLESGGILKLLSDASSANLEEQTHTFSPPLQEPQASPAKNREGEKQTPLHTNSSSEEEQVNPPEQQEPINLQEHLEKDSTENPLLKQACEHIENAQKCLEEAIAQFDDKKKTVIRKQFRKAINALTRMRQNMHELCLLLHKLTILSDNTRVEIDFQATFIKNQIDKFLIPALGRNIQVNFSSLQEALATISQLIPKEASRE